MNEPFLKYDRIESRCRPRVPWPTALGKSAARLKTARWSRMIDGDSTVNEGPGFVSVPGSGQSARKEGHSARYSCWNRMWERKNKKNPKNFNPPPSPPTQKWKKGPLVWWGVFETVVDGPFFLFWSSTVCSCNVHPDKADARGSSSKFQIGQVRMVHYTIFVEGLFINALLRWTPISSRFLWSYVE